MPVPGSSFFWNDAALKRAAKTAMALAARDVKKVAQAKAAYPHVREAVFVLGTGNTYTLGAHGRDATILEHGSPPHEEAPKNAQAMKLKGGGFVKGTIRHPGVRARPFIAPAAALLSEMYVRRGREVFPKPPLRSL